MKKLIYLLLCLFMAGMILSCEKEVAGPGDNPGDDIDTTNQEGNLSDTIFIQNLSGFVQKGPFINGSSITISELKKNLTPTGLNYNTQITDNKGTYGIKDIKFTSQYVELKASGFYFNEVSGIKSTAPLTLYALSDIKDTTSLNVNVLSNLEKGRVEYLVSGGSSFNDAKKQSQEEILAIFNISPDSIKESELLDISKDGDDNAILLAVSVILQGKLTEADLSELLANMSTDLREDGILNSKSIGSTLINNCKYLDLEQIRNNLEARYTNLGTEAVIPDFEKYVNNFIENTEFEFTNDILYPEFTNYGENILFLDKDTFDALIDYSMAANLPVGTSLKIVLKGGRWGYHSLSNGPVNWDVSAYSGQTQTFTSKEDGKSCDLMIQFIPTQPGDDIRIEYYENGATTPTRIKHLTIIDQTNSEPEPGENDTISYPLYTKYGKNILNQMVDTVYIDTTYLMFCNIEFGDSLDVKITGGTWDYEYSGEIPAEMYAKGYNAAEKSETFIFYEPMTEESKITFRFTGTEYTEPVLFEYREVINGVLKTWSKTVVVLNI